MKPRLIAATVGILVISAAMAHAELPKTSFDMSISPLSQAYVTDITANTRISKNLVLGMGIESLKGSEVNQNTLSLIAGLPLTFGNKFDAMLYGRPKIGDYGSIEFGAGSQLQYRVNNRTSIFGKVQTDNFSNLQSNLSVGYRFNPGFLGKVGLYSRLFDIESKPITASAGFSLLF